jgi:transcription initiation factor TFIIB
MVRAHRQRNRERESTTEAEPDETAGQCCSECDAETIVMSWERNEIVCEECGLVIDEQTLDRGPE